MNLFEGGAPGPDFNSTLSCYCSGNIQASPVHTLNSADTYDFGTFRVGTFAGLGSSRVAPELLFDYYYGGYAVTDGSEGSHWGIAASIFDNLIGTVPAGAAPLGLPANVDELVHVIVTGMSSFQFYYIALHTYTPAEAPPTETPLPSAAFLFASACTVLLVQRRLLLSRV